MKRKIKREWKFYVYIVECSNGTYYTGYTNDLARRIKEHNEGKRGAKYLRGKVPVKLVYVKVYKNYKNALKAERNIKKRTRMEKEAMVRAYAKSRDELAPQICCANLSGGLTPKRLLVYIKTFGCQMNVRDSEVICGLLTREGYGLTSDSEKADIILFNTCSVRQHAEDKVWSEIGRIAKVKGQSPKSNKQSNLSGTVPLIGVIGCMAQNYKEKIFERAPQVDFAVGPSDIHKIPEIIKSFAEEKKGQSPKSSKRGGQFGDSPFFKRKIWETDGSVRPEEIYHTGFYEDKNHTYVVISEGCSNYCSYCVVPYVRGELRNRNYKDILKEIEEAVDKGITKITLLGQNVNAYRSPVASHQSPVNFIELLKLVNNIKGLKEFSFVTSHPKDTSIDLFKAMGELEKLKKYLHLPVQSGSDRILKLMNRGYTRKFYLDLIKEYRKIVKNAVLTTDIIVGFPTETEEDFQNTYDLVKEAEFNAAYIFKYSPRPHTGTESCSDDVPKKEKERRHSLILNLQKKISLNKK